MALSVLGVLGCNVCGIVCCDRSKGELFEKCRIFDKSSTSGMTKACSRLLNDKSYEKKVEGST